MSVSFPHVTSSRSQHSRGVALAAVLYFLVLAALTSIAVVFGTRAAVRRSAEVRSDAALVAAADDAVHGALADWNAGERERQAIGATVEYPQPPANGVTVTLWITRLGWSLFSLAAEARGGVSGPARRIALIVSAPVPQPRFARALVSAVDVTIGDSVRVLPPDAVDCGDTASVGITVSPQATVVFDPALAADQRPAVRVDSSAADSAAYLQLNGMAWPELVRRADVTLDPDALLAPSPVIAGGVCRDDPTNWGEPADTTSPCHARVPVVYAPGDLTIEGGRGQGVLLVDGRLTITGAFTYSGQIVVRRGLETRADAISISGSVYAWRVPSESTHTHASSGDVVLTHETSLRYSRCDAAHGMESLLQPHAVHSHAWMELF